MTVSTTTVNPTTSSDQPISCHLTSPPSLTILLNQPEEARRSTGVVEKCAGALTPCGKQVTTDDADLPKFEDSNLKAPEGEGKWNMVQPSIPSSSPKLACKGGLGLEIAVGEEDPVGAATAISSPVNTSQ